MDSQELLAASLSYQQLDQLEGSLADVLGCIITDKPIFPGMGIIHRTEGVGLLPELSDPEVTLANTMSSEAILREHLSSV